MDLYKKIAKLPAEKRKLFELMLMEEGVDLSQLMIMPLDREHTSFPLSYSQQRLWFLDQLEPNSSLYNIAPVLRLKGKLDITALRSSFNEIIRRHEVLRTTFSKQDQEPVQLIAPVAEVPIKLISLEELKPEKLEPALQSHIKTESTKPFDLSRGPLLRVTLVKISDNEHVLILVKHHIVSDNWSIGIMVHELIQLYSAFYAQKPSPLPELQIQYADFAHWQRKWLHGKTLENQISYWSDQLASAPPVLDLPLDKPRPAYQTYNGDYLIFQIKKQQVQELRKLARSADGTLFMVLLAVFYILLKRYSGQEDIAIGSPIANRNRKEVEPLIGFFINTLVLRADLSEDPTFYQLMERIKEMTLGAFAHQDIPFETLVEKLQPGRDMSHSPFFQVMFVFNNVPIEKLELPGLSVSLLEVENKTSKFDLILNVTESDAGLNCKMEFNTDLFYNDTISQMTHHYQVLLTEVLKNPDQTISGFKLLTGVEKSDFLAKWCQSDQHYSESKNILDLIQEQVSRTPEAFAIRIKEESLSYAELQQQVDQLALKLQLLRLKKGQIVGVSLERSSTVIAAMLAIFKLGGVYLPLDPAYPGERLEYMITDSRASILICDSAQKEKLKLNEVKYLLLDSQNKTIQETIEMPNFTSPGPEDVAYVIYTSGSTGKPKGVEITHGALVNHCVDMRDFYQLSADDNVLQFAALNFDASIEQILPPLIAGATVVMRDEEIWDVKTFSNNIKKYDLTVINPPTAYWAQLATDWVREPALLPENRIRLVIVGGDILRPEAFKKWQHTPLAAVRLLNAYGPTEAVITASTFEVPQDLLAAKVPIGKPRANRNFYVLDDQQNLLPQGMPGELFISGNALAKGYLNRPQLTAEKFLADPFTKNRMYRTGDRVRLLKDGNLEFLGRVDSQVKIRGFRIELGEIENVLDQYPEIDQTIVKSIADGQQNMRLVAYYTAAQPLIEKELKAFLQKDLPEYMVPTVFIHLLKFPVDPSGKVNPRLLPPPDFTKLRPETEFIAPRTETEQILVEIVKDILHVEKVGIKDSFFDLGGQSMMATQVVSRIREKFDLELSLRSMFERPTVEGIALSITEIQATFENENELESMLTEIESLSDEDLDNLLNE